LCWKGEGPNLYKKPQEEGRKKFVILSKNMSKWGRVPKPLLFQRRREKSKIFLDDGPGVIRGCWSEKRSETRDWRKKD